MISTEGKGERMKAPDKPLRTRAGAVEYLRDCWGIGRTVSTLAKLASLGGGPRFCKAGRTPLYAEHDLDEWAANLIREPRPGRSAA